MAPRTEERLATGRARPDQGGKNAEHEALTQLRASRASQEGEGLVWAGRVAGCSLAAGVVSRGLWEASLRGDRSSQERGQFNRADLQLDLWSWGTPAKRQDH